MLFVALLASPVMARRHIHNCCPPRQTIVVIKIQSTTKQKVQPKSKAVSQSRHKTIYTRSIKIPKPLHFPHPGRKIPDFVKNSGV